MKYTTTPLVVIGIIVVLSTALVPIHAVASSTASSVTVAVSGDLGSTRLTYQIPTIPMQQVKADGRSCVQLTLDHEAKMLQAGAPEMPVIARSIIIPDTTKMNVKVVDAQYTDYYGLCVVPSKGNLQRTVNPEDVPYTFGDAYTGKAIPTATDGLKLDFPDSWVHFRKSNTEPIIRIIAEAREQQAADLLVSTFTAEILKS